MGNRWPFVDVCLRVMKMQEFFYMIVRVAACEGLLEEKGDVPGHDKTL